ncbi:hypothetical protein Z949_2312 [Sulfitobacter guttiformis KCTC 32187]|nr:hypothetical protein Z949_2312 [Sulfitobacter guttiformis KCTC 32187]
MLLMDTGHHTLSCGSCGAPLRSLKLMPTTAPVAQPAVTHQPTPHTLRKLPKAAPAKRDKPLKRRKGLFRKFAEEAFELIEDILD